MQLGILLLLGGVVAAEEWTSEALTKRAAVLKPAVEAALGRPLGPPVRVHRTSQKELARLIAAEMVQLRSAIVGGPRGKKLRDSCVESGEAYAEIAFGKIPVGGDEIHINGDRLALLAKAVGPDKVQDVIDVVLMHEMAHVYQQRTHDLKAFLGRVRSMEELLAKACVLEGHANLIMARVAKKYGLEETASKLFSGAGPVVTDPVRRFEAEVGRKAALTPYIAGERFVRAVVARLGYDGAVRRLFHAPPKTLRPVFHPEEYFKPDPDRLDLHPLALRCSLLFDSSRSNTVGVTPITEPVMRVLLKTAEAGAVDRAMKGFLDAAAVEVSSDNNDQFLTIVHLVSDAAAQTFLDVSLQAAKGLDALYADPASAEKLVASRYTDVKVGGLGATFGHTVTRYEWDEPADQHMLLMRFGKFVVELISTNEAHARKRLIRRAGRVVDILRSSPSLTVRHPLATGAIDGRRAADLLKALSGDDAAIRMSAVGALGWLEPDLWRAGDTLKQALADKDAGVRLAAVMVARRNGWGIPRAFDDPDWEVREAALWLLLNPSERPDNVGPVFMKALADPSPVVRRSAWAVLTEEAMAKEAGLKRLPSALSDEDLEVRVAAAVWIYDTSIRYEDGYDHVGHDVVDALITLLDHPNERGRIASADALGSLGDDAGRAVDALVKSFADPSSYVRYVAYNALGWIGSPAARTTPLLLKRYDEDPKNRRVIIWAFGNIGGGAYEAVPRLRAILNDEDVDLRRAAANALFSITSRADTRTVEVLLEALKNDESVEQTEAAEALGALRIKAAIPVLIEHLSSDDEDRREMAAESLGAMGVVARSAVDALVRALGDNEEDVSEAAVVALGKIGPAAAAALPALKKLAADKDSPHEESAQDAVVRIEHQE